MGTVLYLTVPYDTVPHRMLNRAVKCLVGHMLSSIAKNWNATFATLKERFIYENLPYFYVEIVLRLVTGVITN